MKIAFVSDPHARGKDLDAFARQWAALWVHCRIRNVAHVVCGGDMFDKQNIGDSNAETGAIIRAVTTPFLSYPRSPVFHCISGNHDQGGAARVSAVEALRGLPGVHVYTEPSVADLGNGLDLCLLPWIYGDMVEGLRALAYPSRYRGLLCAHTQVWGAEMNGVKTATDGIPREHPLWGYFEHIALGDFHKRQQLWPNGGYVGALRQLNHGEEGNPAGFEIYDTDTRETEWVELFEAPRYHTSRVYTMEELQAFQPKALHYNRVITKGFVAPRDLVLQLEQSDISVSAEVERLVRIDRGAEVSETALQVPRELIGVYNGTLDNPFDTDGVAELERLFDEVIA